MPDFPDLLDKAVPPVLTTPYLWPETKWIYSGSYVTQTYNFPNKAIFIPFGFQETISVSQLGWWNGSSVAGNADIGIYDIKGNRILSTGSFACSGTSALQVINITNTLLVPAHYFLAFVMDNASANICCQSAFSTAPLMWGWCEM